MDVLAAITSRRSTRSYLEKPVEFDKVTTIIEAGTYAPCAGDLQDREFILVTDKVTREKIAEHCMEQYWIAQAPALIVVVANEQRTEIRYGPRGKNLYSIQNSAAAIQNMLLTARALGLGTCWVGAFDESYLCELLAIPPTCKPQAIITVGYTNEEHSPKETDLEFLVYFNKYKSTVKKPHLFLRDYSVEWANKTKNIEPGIKTSIEKIKEGVEKLRRQVKK